MYLSENSPATPLRTCVCVYKKIIIYNNVSMYIYIYTVHCLRITHQQPQCLQAACGITFISLLALGELHYATTPNKREELGCLSFH